MKLGLILCLALALPVLEERSELAESMRALRTDVLALDRDPVLERTQELLEGDQPVQGRLRAEVHFARGLVLALDPPVSDDGSLDPDGPRAARSDFGSARALAGPSDLRLDATYNIGWSSLASAEAWYQMIPEVQQAAGVSTPPAPAPMSGANPGANQGGSPGAEAEPPDPLESARDRYVEAREELIVRLRMDWHGEDTRANLEWIQRRLHELDEIEEQRKKQQDPEQNQDQQDQSQDQKDGDSKQQSDAEQNPDQESDQKSDQDSDQKSGQDQKDKQQGEPQDGDQKQGDQKQGDQKQGDQQQGDQQQGDQKQDPQANQPEDQKPSEKSSDDATDSTEEQAPKGQPSDQEGQEQGAATEDSDQAAPERILTREEAMQLLDRLQELEAEGERVRANLRQSRRIPVDRDW